MYSFCNAREPQTHWGTYWENPEPKDKAFDFSLDADAKREKIASQHFANWHPTLKEVATYSCSMRKKAVMDAHLSRASAIIKRPLNIARSLFWKCFNPSISTAFSFSQAISWSREKQVIPPKERKPSNPYLLPPGAGLEKKKKWKKLKEIIYIPTASWFSCKVLITSSSLSTQYIIFRVSKWNFQKFSRTSNCIA